MLKKITIIIWLAFGTNHLMIDGKKKDSAMTVPPVMINVRRLILSAIAIKSSDPKTRITPWIIGHIKA